MSRERDAVIAVIDAALVASDISLEDARVLEQMRVIDVRARQMRNARAIAQERAQRLAGEYKAIGDRIGAPVGRFLSERGVTTATPILKVIPMRLSPSQAGGIGFFGEARERGTNFLNLSLSPADLKLATTAFNVLMEGVIDPFYLELKGNSVMGDVAKLDVTSKGIGPHRLVILRAAVAQLPSPSQPTGK